MGCLYRLTSPSGKQYIGITKHDAATRFERHLNQAKSGRVHAIHNALLKYGAEAFKVETLVIADFDYLRELEPKAIRAFGTFHPQGYNLTYGEASYWTAETTEKVREGQRRAWQRNYESRKKASAPAIVAMTKSRNDPLIEGPRRRKIAETMVGMNRGASNPVAKLSEDQVLKIRKLCEEMSHQKVADLYGISRSLVGFIVQRKRWAHL